MIIEDAMLELLYSLPNEKKLKDIVITRETIEIKNNSFTLVEKAG